MRVLTYMSNRRQFRCTTTLQYGLTRKKFQDERETWLTLRQSNVLPQTHLHSQGK